MANVYGADVQALTDLASSFDQAASQLSVTRQSIGSKVQQSAWVGPVADRFRSDWASGNNSRIASAAQLLTEAAKVLRQNADQQTQASAADGGGMAGNSSFAQAWLNETVGLITAGDSNELFSLGGGAWLNSVDFLSDKLGDIGSIELPGQIYGSLWAFANTTDRSAGALGDAIDWGIAQGPKWMGTIQTIADNPIVSGVTEGLAVVGAGFAVANAAEVWTDPKSTTWQKTDSGISAALAIGAAIPGPQEPFIAGAAVLWQAGNWVADNHTQIAAWASTTAQGIGNVESAAAPVVQAVASTAVRDGEQAVTNLAGGVTSLFSHL